MSGSALAQDRTSGQDTREQARQSSQGPANANKRGIERSNKNSVLKGRGQAGQKQSGQGQTGSMQNSQGQTGSMQNSQGQTGSMQNSQGQTGSMQNNQGQTGPMQNNQGQTGPMQNSQDHTGHDMQNGTMQPGNSQGSQNASPRAQERASENSAVRQGMEARDASGKRIGEVREVRRSSDGTVIAIVVVLVTQVNNTNVVTIPASSFTIVNNVVVINNVNVNVGS
jgi:hypothetical protein